MNKPPVVDYHLVVNHDVDKFNQECSRYVGMGYAPYKQYRVSVVKEGFMLLVHSQAFTLRAYKSTPDPNTQKALGSTALF